MGRTIRFVCHSNDAFRLSAGNFNLPIYKWRAISQLTDSITSVLRNTHWTLRVKNIRELVGLNPENYTTLSERLQGLPKGYSWKIEQAICLYEEKLIDESTLHLLEFCRDTIHRSFSTEESYQDYIIKRIMHIWDLCEEHYGEYKEILDSRFIPSILVLERVDGDTELAENEDFLYKLKGSFFRYDNPISKEMYEIVERNEVKRGTYEYSPYGVVS